MQLLPRHSYPFPRFQIFHPARDFPVPSLLNGLVGGFKAVQQSVGQRCAFVLRERKCSFEKLRNLWGHAGILTGNDVEPSITQSSIVNSHTPVIK